MKCARPFGNCQNLRYSLLTMGRLGLIVTMLGWLLAPCLAQQTNPAPVIVKVKLTHNRIVIPAKINDTPFNFLLDTGVTIPTLHPDVVDELKFQSSGSVMI